MNTHALRFSYCGTQTARAPRSALVLGVSVGEGVKENSFCIIDKNIFINYMVFVKFTGTFLRLSLVWCQRIDAYTVCRR